MPVTNAKAAAESTNRQRERRIAQYPFGPIRYGRRSLAVCFGHPHFPALSPGTLPDLGCDRDSSHDSSQFQCGVGPARFEHQSTVRKRRELRWVGAAKCLWSLPTFRATSIEPEPWGGPARPLPIGDSRTFDKFHKTTRPCPPASLDFRGISCNEFQNCLFTVRLAQTGLSHTKHSPIAQLVERAAVNR